MLDQNKVKEIARTAATANLPSKAVHDILTELTTDSEGRDALRITMVIEPDFVAKLSGDATLDTLVQIQGKLREAGEERLPIIEYATEAELQDSGGS